jgi:hypothetical protein
LKYILVVDISILTSGNMDRRGYKKNSLLYDIIIQKEMAGPGYHPSIGSIRLTFSVHKKPKVSI